MNTTEFSQLNDYHDLAKCLKSEVKKIDIKTSSDEKNMNLFSLQRFLKEFINKNLNHLIM
ncbi:hypothetical protein HERIO_846 [Hepatospora eriocheir]|uniref:Uncharacterized protein n=1 Tax=Hepatospora eriocheir TaxID=1081669 RepID=A0A1X0QC45_9MICR|nr:hypothetical protein HERIO_846 [Hepatospora eriocheir]